jgi:hypothetical protein
MKTTAAPALVLSLLCLSACVDLTKPPGVSDCAGSKAPECWKALKPDTGAAGKDASPAGEDSPGAAPDLATSPIDTARPLAQDTGTKDTPPAIPDLAPDQTTVKLDTQSLVEPPPVEPRPEPTVEPSIVVVEPSATDAATSVDTKPSMDTLPVDTRLSPDVAPANCLETVKTNGYAFPPANPCSACQENSESKETACIAMIDCLATNHPCTDANNCWTNCRNKAMASSVSERCASDLKKAACGSH